MGYLICPLCDKNELSNVQELQQKIAAALSKSLSCPICSASVQGLQAMHLHLATHIPIKGTVTHQVVNLPGSPDQIPSLERLDIRDDRNSPKCLTENNSYQISTEFTEKRASSPARFTDSKTDQRSSSIQYNCDLCGLVFWSEHFLILHRDIIHSKCNSFEVSCKQCKSRFKDLEAYREHVKEIHSDRRYICDHCPKSFKVKGGLLVHTRMYHDLSSPSACRFCKKNFSSRARKEIHERRYHASNMKDLGSPRRTSVLSDSDQINYVGEAKTCLDGLLMATQLHHTDSIKNVATNVETIPLKTGETCGRDLHTQSPHSYHKKLDQQVSSPPGLPYNHNIKVTSTVGNSTNIMDAEINEQSRKQVTARIADDIPISQCESSSKSSCECSKKTTTVAGCSSPVMQVNPTRIFPYSIGTVATTYDSTKSSDKIYGYNTNQESLQNAFYQNLKSLVTLNSRELLPGHLQTSSNVSLRLNYLPLLFNYGSKEYTDNGSNVSRSLSSNVHYLRNSSVPGDITNNNANFAALPNYTISFPPSAQGPTVSKPDTVNASENFIHQVNETVEKLPMEKHLLKSQEEMALESRKSFSAEESTTAETETQLQKSPKSVTKKSSFSNRSSESKLWECEECKKSFTTKYFLKKHKRLHTGETPYSCEECGKTFTFQQSYHKHVFYHSDDKPHVCPYCGRAFKEMSTLHNHIRIHTGEKPFTCLTCGKAFRQRVSYLVHQRIHTGQMPYHCESCSRSFRYKVSLRSHRCEGRNMDSCSSAAGTSHTYSEEAALSEPQTTANENLVNSSNDQDKLSQDKVTEPLGESLDCIRTGGTALTSKKQHTELHPVCQAMPPTVPNNYFSNSNLQNNQLLTDGQNDRLITTVRLSSTLSRTDIPIDSNSGILSGGRAAKEDNFACDETIGQLRKRTELSAVILDFDKTSGSEDRIDKNYKENLMQAYNKQTVVHDLTVQPDDTLAFSNIKRNIVNGCSSQDFSLEHQPPGISYQIPQQHDIRFTTTSQPLPSSTVKNLSSFVGEKTQDCRDIQKLHKVPNSSASPSCDMLTLGPEFSPLQLEEDMDNESFLTSLFS